MGFLVEAIANIAPYIYATCGLLALFQLYRTWQVRAERRQAVFSLERDKAIDDLYRIFLSALLMLVVMGFTYFASTTLREAMLAVESSSGRSSPDDATSSPNGSLFPLIPTPVPTATVRPVAMLIVVNGSEPTDLHTGPGKDYDVIDLVAGGGRVIVDGRNMAGDWLRLYAPTTTDSWIYRPLVTVNIEHLLPVVQSPPLTEITTPGSGHSTPSTTSAADE